MSMKQFPKIPLLLIGVMLLTTLVDSNCPKTQICACTADYINCTCHQHETITFDEEDDEDAFSGKDFIINGCGKILLKKLSLQDVNIQSVHISDLQELEIESFAFYGATITNLDISNIEEFKLETQGFSNVKNITNVKIRNVMLRKLDSSIFSGAFLRLSIKDSYIETMEPRSLHMDNWEDITIENNTIREIAVSAIRISNATRFSFIRNSVEFTQGDSFAFHLVKEVDFGRCRFFQLASNMILTKEIDTFSFHNNYIRTCEEMAFKGIHQAKEVNFVENLILIAKDDSLIPSYKQDEQNFTKLTNENNEIGCNCNIEWLLSLNSKTYNLIKEKNFCHDPRDLKGLSLSLLQINVDKDGNCSSIGMITTTKIPSTTILTNTDTEGKTIATDVTTIASKEKQIAYYTQSNENEPANEQRVSCKDKSKGSSGTKHECSIFLQFALIIILVVIIIIIS